MDDADVLNLKVIAATLEPGRAGALMKFVTLTLEKTGGLPADACEQLDAAAWRSFVHEVWFREMADEPPIMARHVAGVGGGDYCGEARWGPKRPIIEVDDEGLTRITALHEIAHLITDMSGPVGHGWAFAREFVRLIGSWVSFDAATHWQREWAVALHEDKSWLSGRKG